MSVPQRDQSGWEVGGESPRITGPQEKPDKLGIAIVAIVLAAIAVAVVVLLL